VKSNSRNRQPSWRRQLTAVFAALLVLALAVLAVSPELHAWVHGHDGVSLKGTATPSSHDDQQADHDDDGCVVTMFANGVILSALGLFVISALWQFINLVSRMEKAGYRQTLRYWLPPLCGPPLS
jgi:ABC-type Fe3+ transport system permease subunit